MTSISSGELYVHPHLTADRWTTFDSLGPSQLGPAPYPDWLVTSGWAQDTELGILKTGKEAEVSLLARATDEAECLLACKRYRDRDQKQFRRESTYREGQSIPDKRAARAIGRGTSFGRKAAESVWAQAEWRHHLTLYAAGIPVPYPVSYDGSELLMEYIGDREQAAPRLINVDGADVDVDDLWEQFQDIIHGFARIQMAHGDLSPYNTLLWQGRLVVIDFPQMLDVISHPLGMDYLFRDVENMCGWFQRNGLDVDAGHLFGEVLASI